MYTKLSGGEFKKRTWRLPIFIEKIKTGKPFALVDGSEVVLKKEPLIIQALEMVDKSGDYAQLNKMIFVTARGKQLKIGQFGKSAEFGGRGQGSGTAAEDRALSMFREEIQKACKKEGTPFIMVRIAGRTVELADVATTPGTPKSDFHGLDTEGKEVCWFSHKDGRTAKDFQQYGGITELMKKFPGHAELTKFINDVNRETDGEVKSDRSFQRPLKDRNVMKAAVYGIDYDKKPGRQNVDMFLQGRITVKKRGKVYEIGSEHSGSRGDIPTRDYACVLFVRKGDRNNFGIKNARFMVAPKALRRRSTVDI